MSYLKNGILSLKKAAAKAAAGNYIQGGAEVFEEYRALRDSGYSKDEATLVMLERAPLYILSAKADDYIRNNKVAKISIVCYD